MKKKPVGTDQHFATRPPQPPILPKEGTPEIILHLMFLQLIFFLLTFCSSAKAGTSLAWSSSICCKLDQNLFKVKDQKPPPQPALSLSHRPRHAPSSLVPKEQ